ncbi:hypothetical protein [Citricoccus nitrophenolicus]|uniref:hypothetical protein n=1 Tax=Citricoccus nitrophenolicus TaxID=863575 RepID=UPI0039B3B5CD
MTGLNNAEYAGTGHYHQREGYWEMLAPWAMLQPNPDQSDEAAVDFANNLQLTRERFDEIFDLWGQLVNHYQCADADLVATAMNDQIGPAMALAQAGQMLMGAHTTYSATIEGSSVKQTWVDNLGWAPGFVDRWKAMEADKSSLDDEEFEEKYGKPWAEVQSDLQIERGTYQDAAADAVQKVKDARQAYKDSIGDIDLGDLANLRFSKREEALDVADDVDELTDWIMNSEAFEGLGLTEEQARRIAEDAFGEGGFSGQYTDAEGRTWVRAPDGRMVRAGSMMDPNLTESILVAMANDPEVGEMEIQIPSSDGQDVINTTISQLYGRGSEQAQDYLENHRPDMDKNRTARGFTGLGVAISLLQGAHGANSQRELEENLYPLFTEDILDERRDVNLGKSAITTGASTVVGFVAGAAAPVTGGGSILIGAVVDQVTGEIVGWLVEWGDEQLNTWDIDEVDELSDGEFPE